MPNARQNEFQKRTKIERQTDFCSFFFFFWLNFKAEKILTESYFKLFMTPCLFFVFGMVKIPYSVTKDPAFFFGRYTINVSTFHFRFLSSRQTHGNCRWKSHFKYFHVKKCCVKMPSNASKQNEKKGWVALENYQPTYRNSNVSVHLSSEKNMISWNETLMPCSCF